ncbi:MAG: type II toxin-antitoxin system YafQ family toxin [Verrucomicrobia bacterium]|nr:type II toxin-antitoxin system YafQ family toxin [Verrucomicrobiota bacterium]
MKLSQTSQFKKDLKKQIKRGKDLEKVSEVVDIILRGEPLPPQCKDHPLIGKWKNRRDCHIEPDWILIYRLTEDELRLERTGTHSDLF